MYQSKKIIIFIVLVAGLILGLAPVVLAEAVPTINIVSVKPDAFVNITTRQFPPHRDFIVTMGPVETLGEDGIVVGEFNSGEDGKLKLTFPIPVELRGSEYIAIRAQTADNVFYSYNWFDNTEDTAGNPAPSQPRPEVEKPEKPKCDREILKVNESLNNLLHEMCLEPA